MKEINSANVVVSMASTGRGGGGTEAGKERRSELQVRFRYFRNRRQARYYRRDMLGIKLR
jgi:hypothetical protein